MTRIAIRRRGEGAVSGWAGASRKRSFALFCALALLLSASYAWISDPPFTSSTHKPMADRAIDIVSPTNQDEYKDIYHFRSRLRLRADHEGSHLNDDDISNLAAVLAGGAANGGPVELFWDQAQNLYKHHEFVMAYQKIGWIAHLLQDEAAPAHGANINHGRWKHKFTWPTAHWAQGGIGDNCEWYATHRSFENVPLLDLGAAAGPHQEQDAEPDDYCDLMIAKTRDAILNAFPPPDGTFGGPWTNYWEISTDDASLLCSSQNAAAFGEYGLNRFPGREFQGSIVRNQHQVDKDYPEGYFAAHSRPFLQHRTKDAIEWTAGMFMTASEALPPFIFPPEYPSALPPILTHVCHATEADITVRFAVFENRKKNVTISVKWDGVEKMAAPTVDLDASGDTSLLPWRKIIVVKFKSPLGQHTLDIDVADADGHHAFDIDGNPAAPLRIMETLCAPVGGGGS